MSRLWKYQGCARPDFSHWDWDWDLVHSVSNIETDTETFTPWYQILRLRLRLRNGVSNFETETETLVFWSQCLRPRLRPANYQILRLRLFEINSNYVYVCWKRTKIVYYNISLYNNTSISESSIKYGPATQPWKYRQNQLFFVCLKRTNSSKKTFINKWLGTWCQSLAKGKISNRML